ncbi:MAG: hypothetical protein II950_06800 [Prevotella sp.]|nr:hypothetical protein [Prevotella sp.]
MKKLLQIMLLALMPLCMQAQTVTINTSNASTYLSKTAPEVIKTSAYRFTVKDHPDLRNAKKIIIAADLPANTYRDFQYNHGGSNPNVAHSTVLANLEELELQEGHNIQQLQVWGTRLKKLIINNPSSNNYFRELNVAGSFLTEDDIILGDNVKFDQLHLHRNKITSLEKFYNRFKEPVGSNRTAGLYCNGGPYIRSEHAYVDEDERYEITNVLREIDMSQIPLIVHGFQFRHNLLEHLDAGGHTNIANMLLSYNLLWSLDFNSVTTAPKGNYTISPQKPVADLTVVKGTAEDGSGDEVRLNLPVEQNALFNGERLMPDSVKLLNQSIATQALQHDGTQNYFKVASVADGATADLDLYEKDNGFSYLYDHRPNFAGTTNDSLRYMKVEVKTYPYIMYINPLTKQPGNNINFYSGTLWLDYDAIVPAGTTVWIVTGIRSKSKIVSGGTASAEDQLELKPIGEEGDLIPAGTAMFVRSDSKAGLYDFQKVWTHKLLGWSADTVMYEKVYTTDQLTKLQATRDKIAELGGNLLEGADTITDFHGPRRALILGFESEIGTGVVGFWPYTGRYVPAHRCFITETTYKNAAGSNSAKGGIFFFNDPETTGITHVNNNNVSTDDDAWYSLDGRRLSGKPSWKGVYIHKGRKEVIR